MTYLFSSNVEVSNDIGNPLPITVTNTNGNIVSVLNPFPVTLGSNSITITGNVNVMDKIMIWDGNVTLTFDMPDNDGEPGQPSIPVENYNYVFNGNTWDRMRGNTTTGILVNLTNSNVSVTQGTDPWKITGNVGITGNVNVNPHSTSITNGNISVFGNISGITSLPAITGNVGITGNVTLNPNTEIEIKNDINNPIPVSKNTGVNTYLNPMYVHFGRDTELGMFTSKNRLKVSDYQVTFHNTFQFSKGLDFWDEATINGSSVTWDPLQSSCQLTVSSTHGSKVIRQTRQVMPYIPGRAASFSMAHEWHMPIIGCRARIGVFDNNNGVFFEQGPDQNYYCVIRSSTSGSPVDTRVAREHWSGEHFDGSNDPVHNISGITANPMGIQLIVIDYEWYGAGFITFSYVMNGIKYAIHTFETANVLADVWSSTPFVPIRVELENISGSAGQTIWQSSSSWQMEGKESPSGVPMVISKPDYKLVNKDTYYPVISVKLKDNCINAVNILKRLQTITPQGNTLLLWKLIVNPTLTGASWVDHPLENSTMQYDISATSYTNGIEYYSGVVDLAGSEFEFDPDGSAFQMARHGLTTVGNGISSDIVTIAVSSSIANTPVWTYLRWREMR